MPLDRKLLLERLELVAPALSENDLIPALTHFWFQDDRVMAFNDHIAISTPLKTGLVGAIPGKLLLELLKASRAKDVEFKVDGDNVLVKAAGSRLNLGLLPSDAFVFDMPAPKSKALFPIETKAFLSAVSACMRSTTSDTSVPDYLGVTLIPDDKYTDIFSTNNYTLTHASVPSKSGLKERVILSADFCRQLLALKPEGPLRLEIQNDYALAQVDGTHVFGQLIATSRPLNFHHMLDHHLQNNSEKKFVSIPTKLALILARATIVTDSKVDQTSTLITVQDGIMRFDSKSARGEVKDSMQIEKQHPNVSVKLQAKFLKTGIEYFDRLLITDRCAIMQKDNLTYLVSSHG